MTYFQKSHLIIFLPKRQKMIWQFFWKYLTFGISALEPKYYVVPTLLLLSFRSCFFVNKFLSVAANCDIHSYIIHHAAYLVFSIKTTKTKNKQNKITHFYLLLLLLLSGRTFFYLLPAAPASLVLNIILGVCCMEKNYTCVFMLA